MFFIAFTIIFTINFMGDGDDDTTNQVLLWWCIVFIIYETWQLFTLRSKFLKNVWNIIEFIRVFLVMMYLLTVLSGDSTDEERRSWLPFAVFVSWLRVIGYFRFFRRTRKLIRMFTEIIKDSLAFLAIFLTFVLAISFSLMAQRDLDFWEAWQHSYRIAYADFEEEYVSIEAKFFFLLATIVMPLVMFNLLIAIMGDSYARVQASSTEADVREKLMLIEEIGRILLCMRRGSKLQYLKECRDASFGGSSIKEEVDPLERKIKEVKKDLKKQVNHLRLEVKQSDNFVMKKLNKIEKQQDKILKAATKAQSRRTSTIISNNTQSEGNESSVLSPKYLNVNDSFNSPEQLMKRRQSRLPTWKHKAHVEFK